MTRAVCWDGRVNRLQDARGQCLFTSADAVFTSSVSTNRRQAFSGSFKLCCGQFETLLTTSYGKYFRDF